MSFTSFKKYIAKIGFAESSFDNSYEKMKKIAYYLIAAVSPKIRRRQYTFEVSLVEFSCSDSTLCWTKDYPHF
jgi:hypothetical protein